MNMIENIASAAEEFSAFPEQVRSSMENQLSEKKYQRMYK